ncbi:MAG TPA: response regulator transcription factor [Solirubrobacteraceae bacterium]|jgi:DNA-binding NarL/FixJ family response regulator|nr:response regulator transcription factor [Solirubrobacteraceae bacterium]
MSLSFPIRVFLCDDVPEFRGLMRLILEEDPGFMVVGEAGDGVSAVEGIRHARPDVVLLDLSMPGFDGLEVIQRIKALDLECCIVVLSGFSGRRMGKLAREAGVVDYVEKGAGFDEIRAAARRAGELSRRGVCS